MIGTCPGGREIPGDFFCAGEGFFLASGRAREIFTWVDRIILRYDDKWISPVTRLPRYTGFSSGTGGAAGFIAVMDDRTLPPYLKITYLPGTSWEAVAGEC